MAIRLMIAIIPIETSAIAPYRRKISHCTEHHHPQNNDPKDCQACFMIVLKEDQVGFGVRIIRHQRGESKEENGYRDKDRTPNHQLAS